jgi:hypothetical protein
LDVPYKVNNDFQFYTGLLDEPGFISGYSSGLDANTSCNKDGTV